MLHLNVRKYKMLWGRDWNLNFDLFCSVSLFVYTMPPFLKVTGLRALFNWVISAAEFRTPGPTPQYYRILSSKAIFSRVYSTFANSFISWTFQTNSSRNTSNFKSSSWVWFKELHHKRTLSNNLCLYHISIVTYFPVLVDTWFFTATTNRHIQYNFVPRAPSTPMIFWRGRISHVEKSWGRGWHPVLFHRSLNKQLVPWNERLVLWIKRLVPWIDDWFRGLTICSVNWTIVYVSWTISSVDWTTGSMSFDRPH